MPWPCGQQHRTVGSLTTPLSCSPFAFSGEPKGAACPAPLGDPPGHPTTRPFGFAALLGLAGSGRTRRYAPQTCCRSYSRQPCATRPRKRGLGPCILLFVRPTEETDTYLRAASTASGPRLAAPKNCSTMPETLCSEALSSSRPLTSWVQFTDDVALRT